MRSLYALLIVLLLATTLLAGDDHQTAEAEASIGADLEVMTRDPDLGVADGYPDTLIVMTPEVEDPGSTRMASAEALMLGTLAQTVYARVHATAVASDAGATIHARSGPFVELVNARDDPMFVTIRVRVPGAFPTPAGPPYAMSDYRLRASTDDNWAELARVSQQVSVVASPFIEAASIRVLDVQRETRPPLTSGEPIPDDPVIYDVYGIPFQHDYTVIVPPSFVQADPSTIEIRPYPIGLWVIAEARALSVLPGSASEPIQFEMPELCTLSAPPDAVRNRFADLDSLCRAGRAGAAPVCKCLRDDALRSQRCTFNFPDFFATVRLPAPAYAGQPVDPEWTILPTGDPAEFWMKSEMYVGGKWIPVAQKGKLDGKFTEGKTNTIRTSWTMPSTPTMLRTRLFHLPKGAKQATESTMTTMVALSKPKGVDGR